MHNAKDQVIKIARKDAIIKKKMKIVQSYIEEISSDMRSYWGRGSYYVQTNGVVANNQDAEPQVFSLLPQDNQKTILNLSEPSRKVEYKGQIFVCPTAMEEPIEE